MNSLKKLEKNFLKNGQKMTSSLKEKNILDTNVLVRFLVGDNKSQQEQAEEWFHEAETGERKITVKSIVVAEACFVLESFYKKSRKEIAQALQVFLSQRWLSVEDRDVLHNMWEWYLKNLHFVDSFLLSWMKINNATLLSFDKQALKELKRIKSGK